METSFSQFLGIYSEMLVDTYIYHNKSQNFC